MFKITSVYSSSHQTVQTLLFFPFLFLSSAKDCKDNTLPFWLLRMKGSTDFLLISCSWVGNSYSVDMHLEGNKLQEILYCPEAEKSLKWRECFSEHWRPEICNMMEKHWRDGKIPYKNNYYFGRTTKAVEPVLAGDP